MKKIGIIAVFAVAIGFGIYYFLYLKRNENYSEVERLVRDFQNLQEKEVFLDKFSDVDAIGAKKMIDENSGIKVIDASADFKKGHIPKASNYYLGDGTLDKMVTILDKEAEYIIYSNSDTSSISAAQKLINNGFKKIYRLNGNYESWVSAGFDVEYLLTAAAGKGGSGTITKSVNKENSEFTYNIKAEMADAGDKKVYAALFRKEKPKESFFIGALDKKQKGKFAISYKTNEDLKKFDEIVIVLREEGDLSKETANIMLVGRVSNFE